MRHGRDLRIICVGSLQVEVMSLDGKKAVRRYSLDPAAAQRTKEDSTQVAHHASSSVEQSRLSTSSNVELQVTRHLYDHQLSS